MLFSFDCFVAQIFNSSPTLKKYYGTIDIYKSFYIKNTGFNEWLESLRNKTLSQELTENLAQTYLNHTECQCLDVPKLLASIMRQYNIEIPIEEGILTSQYWLENISSDEDMT